MPEAWEEQCAFFEPSVFSLYAPSFNTTSLLKYQNANSMSELHVVWGSDMKSPKPYIEQTPQKHSHGFNASHGQNPRTATIPDTSATFTWYDLIDCPESPAPFEKEELEIMSSSDLKATFREFTNAIAELTDSNCKAEKKFFLGWRDLCIEISEREGGWQRFTIEEKSFPEGTQYNFYYDEGVTHRFGRTSGSEARLKSSMWYTPCLIPQCRVNAYLNKSNPSEAVPEKFDFLLSWGALRSETVIVEVDGHSHCSTMDSFTEHTQKDRFLRRRGWEVFRFTVQEIDDFPTVEHLFQMADDGYDSSNLVCRMPLDE